MSMEDSNNPIKIVFTESEDLAKKKNQEVPATTLERVILLRRTHISNNKHYSFLFFSLFSISFFAERIKPSDLLYVHGKKNHK